MQDIKSLQANKVRESDILDYKSGLDESDEMPRHVSAFANTRGGRIIYGIRESGKGGYPKDLLGIPSEDIDLERIEQILLSNIVPRLQVRLKQIEHDRENKSKSFLIVEIPDSALKPHMVEGKGKYRARYYRRFQFESPAMTELEVSDAYRRRFTTHEEVEAYLGNVMSYSPLRYRVLGRIVTIPGVLTGNLIETTNKESFAWMDPNVIDPEPEFDMRRSYIPGFPEPSPYGLILRRDKTPEGPWLQVHRNGCIDYSSDFDDGPGGTVHGYHLGFVRFCKRLLHTLQFASMVYAKCNYFGEVKILVSIFASQALVLPIGPPLGEPESSSSSISVGREFPSAMLESDFSYIASGIMNELFNYFGLWRCKLFNEEGRYIPEKFRPGASY